MKLTRSLRRLVTRIAVLAVVFVAVATLGTGGAAARVNQYWAPINFSGACDNSCASHHDDILIGGGNELAFSVYCNLGGLEQDDFWIHVYNEPSGSVIYSHHFYQFSHVAAPPTAPAADANGSDLSLNFQVNSENSRWGEAPCSWSVAISGPAPIII